VRLDSTPVRQVEHDEVLRPLAEQTTPAKEENHLTRPSKQDSAPARPVADNGVRGGYFYATKGKEQRTRIAMLDSTPVRQVEHDEVLRPLAEQTTPAPEENHLTRPSKQDSAPARPVADNDVRGISYKLATWWGGTESPPTQTHCAAPATPWPTAPPSP